MLPDEEKEDFEQVKNSKRHVNCIFIFGTRVYLHMQEQNC